MEYAEQRELHVKLNDAAEVAIIFEFLKAGYEYESSHFFGCYIIYKPWNKFTFQERHEVYKAKKTNFLRALMMYNVYKMEEDELYALEEHLKKSK